MGIVAVKIKIMPEGVDSNLEEIKKQAKALVEKLGGKNCQISEEPIAFGLNALIVFFAWQEEKELESLEQKLSKIKNVSSVQVIDMRRAFG